MKRIELALLEDQSRSSDNGNGEGSKKPQAQYVKADKLSPALACVLKEVQREIGYTKEDNKQGSLNDSDLEILIDRVSERLGFELSSFERDEVILHLRNEEKPFGVLQPLIDNPKISDIIISDFCHIAVQEGRKNYQTDLRFPTQEAYEVFVERLLQRANSTYSTKKPIADGMIGAFARIHAVHRVLCETGPYVTIRLNRFSSISIEQLIEFGLAPRGVLEYMAGIVRTGNTLLVVGEVGTGKTTLARALASSMPMHESILVIEDTPEIRLDHQHVRYMRTRESNTDGAGRVTPSECIRAGMRMAMNRIIFGEIRDAEAAEAFIDVCASGHPGLTTIHARSAAEAVVRLELFLGRAQKGVSQKVLAEQVATAVQVIANVDICKETGKRRIMEVREIGPVADGILRQREIFRYGVRNGIPGWEVRGRVSAHREQLEEGEHPIKLGEFPPVLELHLSHLYKESAEAA